jgi:hypothetical protein
MTMAVFRRLDPYLRISITLDNDTAFARYGLLASACAMATWLALSAHNARSVKSSGLLGRRLIDFGHFAQLAACRT